MKKVLTAMVSIMVILVMAVSASASVIVNVENPAFDENYNDTIYFVEIHCFENEIFIDSNEKAEELVNCILKDRENIPEEELDTTAWGFEVRVGIAGFDEEKNPELRINYHYIDSQHKNTIDWVKENGYWEFVEIPDAPVYIIKAPEYLPFMDFWDMAIELNMDELDVVSVFKGEDIATFSEYIYSGKKADNFNYGEKYLAYSMTEDGRFRFISALSSSWLKEIVK